MKINQNSVNTTTESRGTKKGAANNDRSDATAYKPGNAGASAPQDDSVLVSSAARALQRAEVSFDGVQPFDAAKVREIKAAIDRGEYKVDPEKLAQSILDNDGIF